ncbi:hypothetical protein [Shewanella sp. 10N.286.54.B9]|uniref:hypothetical protein n=1 Tax=Shewanella sp. 10N.286.54.B9 TaxID=3229719 RepID=UPI00354B0FCC
MENHIKYLAILLMVLGMTACQGVQFRTNLTPSYVVDAYEASKVVEYSVEEVYNHDSQMIGDVNASYCQTINTPPPVYSKVVDNLKFQVQQIGGNGIVVMECTKEDPFAACIARLECRALAYEVKFS